MAIKRQLVMCVIVGNLVFVLTMMSFISKSELLLVTKSLVLMAYAAILMRSSEVMCQNISYDEDITVNGISLKTIGMIIGISSMLLGIFNIIPHCINI